MLLLSILLLFLIGGIIYWSFSRKEKNISKKVSIPFLIFSVFIIFLGSNADHSSLTNALEDERKNNEQLLIDKNELEEMITTLELKVDDLEENIGQLDDEVHAITLERDRVISKVNEIQTEVEALTAENLQLKKDKQELQATIEKTQAQAENSTTKTSSTNASTSTHSPQTSNSNVQKATAETKVATTSTSTSSNNSDCNIKGSVNGIYHLPGGAYYNRTKNVVQWFCSANEAEKAGYRAAKR